MGRATFAHRLEYLVFVLAAGVVRRLPEGAALALGSALGWVSGSLLRIRRKVVEENLGRAFPDRDSRWRRRTAAAAYRHLAREGVALLRLVDLSPEELRERCRVEGLEHVREPLGRGRGVLILTGHLGNWEVAGAALAVNGIPLDVVARPQSNPLFDAHLRRTRERLGMRVIHRGGRVPRGRATRAILRALREPRAVALVADQNVRVGGMFLDFFGVSASTHRGPGLIASRTGDAVVLGTILRIPGSPARYRVRIRPLPAPDPGGPEEDPGTLTRRYLEGLEEAIREDPAQYFWLHRRWKTRPEEPPAPGTVPE